MSILFGGSFIIILEYWAPNLILIITPMPSSRTGRVNFKQYSVAPVGDLIEKHVLGLLSLIDTGSSPSS